MDRNSFYHAAGRNSFYHAIGLPGFGPAFNLVMVVLLASALVVTLVAIKNRRSILPVLAIIPALVTTMVKGHART